MINGENRQIYKTVATFLEKLTWLSYSLVLPWEICPGGLKPSKGHVDSPKEKGPQSPTNQCYSRTFSQWQQSLCLNFESHQCRSPKICPPSKSHPDHRESCGCPPRGSLVSAALIVMTVSHQASFSPFARLAQLYH